ncbi:hypothetical protein Q5P01_011446 [Channa striata]|uniref:Uncharacterized protein n=1 Tax=Channa striata TaxID=64152 RepID=A0AA88MZG4_CHASR|nr:hypothetical protein Q5P01_011446 [Channa striata]
MCTQPPANVVSSPHRRSPHSCLPEERRKARELQGRTELITALLSDYFTETRSLRKIMFVPLPVPFVFQRTAPDLNAWRLKSPLALRSNSACASPSPGIFSLLSPSPSFPSPPLPAPEPQPPSLPN